MDQGSEAKGGARVAARFGSKVITLADVDRIAAAEIFEFRSTALRQALVGSLLQVEAKKHGLSLAELRKREVDDAVATPTRAEAAAAVKEWVSAGDIEAHEASEMTEDQVIDRLRRMRVRQREEAYFDELFRRHGVVVDFDALGKPELKISLDAPSMGAKSATVTIVEFADLTESFTALWQPTLERLVAEYGQRVRFLFKQKPKTTDPDSASVRIAEAALCANDQERYWEFRRALFEQGSGGLPVATARIAASIDLDVPRFEACLSSREKRAIVDRDAAEARLNGLRGDPVVSVDGIRLSGAHPFETVDRLLRLEMKSL